MNKKPKFFIVDDDPISVKLLAKYLKTEAETVSYSTSSISAISQIIEQKPDCVLLDILMPEMDGLELCRRLRSEKGLDSTKIVIVTGKAYGFDRKRALSFGANGYITKPVDRVTLISQIKRILEDRIEITYWGIRGTLPVPGKETVKYGGNTSCVTLEFPRGNLFIFDAGTGIKALSDHFMEQKRSGIEAEVFISHPHWDHINALPIFDPLYVKGNSFVIHGPSHCDITMRELISAQMDGVYFPINIKEFAASVNFRDLKEETFYIDGIKIKTMLLNHPGQCLGYRVEYNTRSVCYVTDNEIYPKPNQFYNDEYVNKLIEFVMNSDVLITDCTYDDQEYDSKICWGHSSVGQVIELADLAKIRNLHLFHHDPAQTDIDIEAKLERAQALLEKRKSTTRCVAPKEKQVFKI